MNQAIKKRDARAVLSSLSAGVTPRRGLEHIAVGRKDEVQALLDDFNNGVAEGGGSFRLISGRFGSGKSFLCQLLRNYAIGQGFVVADADLSPERRLVGTTAGREGLATYRELLKNLATRTRPDGGAFEAILDRWIQDIQNQVVQEENIPAFHIHFQQRVDARIRETLGGMQGLVHGFDFATVLNAYWRGYHEGDEATLQAALRWLRGEYQNKLDAKRELGVASIITDKDWYDYLKILARFVHDIGYRGLIVFIDEAVNLYMINHRATRNNNYEKLLSMLNDTLQGGAEYLGIVVGVTPQMVEDKERGLFSNAALRSRLQDSRFMRTGLRNLNSPIIKLEMLSAEEVFVLLRNLRRIHGSFYDYEPAVTDVQIEAFLNEAFSRLGANQALTPRDLVRDFISVLDLLHQNPGESFESVVGTYDFTHLQNPVSSVEEMDQVALDSPYKSFTI